MSIPAFAAAAAYKDGFLRIKKNSDEPSSFFISFKPRIGNRNTSKEKIARNLESCLQKWPIYNDSTNSCPCNGAFCSIGK